MPWDSCFVQWSAAIDALKKGVVLEKIVLQDGSVVHAWKPHIMWQKIHLLSRKVYGRLPTQ
jgi:hypothetical protein